MEYSDADVWIRSQAQGSRYIGFFPLFPKRAKIWRVQISPNCTAFSEKIVRGSSFGFLYIFLFSSYSGVPVLRLTMYGLLAYRILLSYDAFRFFSIKCSKCLLEFPKTLLRPGTFWYLLSRSFLSLFQKLWEFSISILIASIFWSVPKQTQVPSSLMQILV